MPQDERAAVKFGVDGELLLYRGQDGELSTTGSINAKKNNAIRA